MNLPARLLLVVGIFVLAAGYWLTDFDAHFAFFGDGRWKPTRVADAVNGKVLFAAGGCISCHTTPGSEDRVHLGGGKPLKTPFGTFYPPNISSDPQDGIGRWTETQFIRAVRDGTGPDGKPYYPAFPYTSYRHMSPDLVAKEKKVIADWRATADRYESDPAKNEGKKELTEKALAFERQRDSAMEHYHVFEIAGVVLQISVVLASTSVVTGVASVKCCKF